MDAEMKCTGFPCSDLLFSTRCPPRLQPRLVLPNLVWATFRLPPPSVLCLSRVLPRPPRALQPTLLSPTVHPTSVSSDEREDYEKTKLLKKEDLAVRIVSLCPWCADLVIKEMQSPSLFEIKNLAERMLKWPIGWSAWLTSLSTWVSPQSPCTGASWFHYAVLWPSGATAHMLTCTKHRTVIHF